MVQAGDVVAGLSRFGLDDGRRAQLAALLKLLGEDEHAPTAVCDPLQALDVHVADSLTALEVAALREARAIADLGSGAGFPGVAIAVALPGAEVVLVESVRRSCEFLERMLAAGSVTNARVACARVEDWREGFDGEDAVLARALAPQPVVLEYAAPLLRIGGVLVDWRGRRAPEEEAAASKAAAELGLELDEIRRVQPFAHARNRHLHVYRKVSPTPERFPRRAGMARKRPLG